MGDGGLDPQKLGIVYSSDTARAVGLSFYNKGGKDGLSNLLATSMKNAQVSTPFL